MNFPRTLSVDTTREFEGEDGATDCPNFIFVHEEEKEEWAKEMKDLLILGKQEVENMWMLGMLPKAVLRHVEETYDQIIQRGLQYHTQLLLCMELDRDGCS